MSSLCDSPKTVREGKDPREAGISPDNEFAVKVKRVKIRKLA